MASWSDDPDVILYATNYYKASIDKAIEFVRDYVIEHKLILTGGTAIDLALRSKGDKIYEDDALPDYDCVSDKNVYHAQTLAKILCQAGLEDINVINAFHITTMRVRFKRVPLFDATYIPTDVLNKIPYLDVPIQLGSEAKLQRVFRVIHPNYQKIDQRLSLSNLMQITGSSLNIFNRMKKDIKRNNILVKYFDVPPAPSKKANMKTVSIPLDMLICDAVDIHETKTDVEILGKPMIVYQITSRLCCYGLTAYAILQKAYLDLCKEAKLEPIKTLLDVRPKITEKQISFDVPFGYDASFLSCVDEMDLIVKDLNIELGTASLSKYNKLLDLKGVSYRLDYKTHNIELIDSFDQRYNCNLYSVVSSGETDGMMICVSNYNKVLSYCLSQYFMGSQSDRDIYLGYYHSATDMATHIQTEFKDIQSDLKYMFVPSIHMYGSNSNTEAAYFMLMKILDTEQGSKQRPGNAYPKEPECDTYKEFHIDKSEFYNNIDGKENESIKHTNHGYLTKQFQSLYNQKKT
jgi:hypothetical protein